MPSTLPRRLAPALLASALLILGAATAASAQDVGRLMEASAAAEAGDHAAAARIYESVLEDGAAGSSAPGIHYAAAVSLAQAGGGEEERTRAFEHLRAALRQKAVPVEKVRKHDALAALREDPRWEALMSKVAAGRAFTHEALREELLAMEEEDQRVRRELIAAGAATPDSAMVARVQAIDSSNTARLKEIINALGGWPRHSQVGRKGADAAFLIAQHADLDPAFQRRVLPLLREAYEKGETSGQNVALLTDRVRVAEGREQFYGTQTYFEDGEIVFHPITGRDEVDERRAQMGLMPLEEYAAFVREMYQQPSDTLQNDTP